MLSTQGTCSPEFGSWLGSGAVNGWRGLTINTPFFGCMHALLQVAVFGLYKLLKVGSHADNLVAFMRAGGGAALVRFLSVTGGAASSGNSTGSTAGTNSTGGLGSTGSTGGGRTDGGTRDMAWAILLDMALVPEAGAHAADARLVAPLVQVCPLFMILGFRGAAVARLPPLVQV